MLPENWYTFQKIADIIRKVNNLSENPDRIYTTVQIGGVE